MIINQANISTLKQTYNGAFKGAFAGVQTKWGRVATEVPSSAGSNIYAWMGNFPRLRKWLGDRQHKNLKASKFELVNDDYEGTVDVARNDIKDDQYGIYATNMAELGASSAALPDELVFSVLAAGHSTECYDGQYLLDTDHPYQDTTKANYDGTSGTISTLWCLMDTTRPMKPLIYQQREACQLRAPKADDFDEIEHRTLVWRVDGRMVAGPGLWQLVYGSTNNLTEANFNAAMAVMMALESDEKAKLGITPNLLVCGPSRRAEALALIEAQYTSSGASNPNYKAVEVLITPWMS